MEVLYAYLAGAIDADGFVSVGRKIGHRRRANGEAVCYYVVKLGLSETNPTIPDLLQQTFPAWRGSYQPRNPAHKRWHIWQATNGKAREPLLRLGPHLRLKRQQAALAVELLDIMAEQNRARFMGNRLTIEQEAARHAIYMRVTQLNAPRNRRVHFPEIGES